jgi:hypothetical protein
MTTPPPPPRSQKVLQEDGTFNQSWSGWFRKVAQSVGTVLTAFFNPTFMSGYVLYAGPNGTITANTNFIFGLKIPNPSGTPAPAILIGSGVPQAWIVTDAVLAGTPGINLGIVAGEAAAGSSDIGGALLLLGGGADHGVGGKNTLQGGTSLNGTGGQAIVAGGNSTNGPAGDAFVIAGQTGTAGGNVHLIATSNSGVPGDVRIRLNSTILLQILGTGEIFLTLSGTGSGTAGQKLTSQGPGLPAKWV